MESGCEWRSNVSQYSFTPYGYVSWTIFVRLTDFLATSLDHRDSDSEKFAYDLLEIYDGLPTYKWSSKSTDSMEDFKNNANYYNYYLYSRLLDVLGEKLGIHRRQFGYHKFGFTGRKGYLTNRSSRLIAGDNAGSVQARNFAMPLVIPKVCAFGVRVPPRK